jgi:SAM-dependent methyltransferase
MSYGNYIVNTGREIERLELAMGRYIFQSKFLGRAPILDVGAGRCWFTKAEPKKIIALDSSPEIVDKYKNENIDIRLGSAYTIPFEDAYFEGVFSCWLFEHLANPLRAAKEMYRILKPSGYFYAIVPSERSLLKGFYDDVTHIRPFTKAACIQLVTYNGFQKVKVEPLYWGRFQKQVAALFGEEARRGYIRFLDLTARKVGLINRNNYVIEAWK